jgi:eukaryotic-like serine/threonine-protein kinase
LVAQPPFDPASLPPGTRIADKYELGPAIGVGVHSVVYAALHRLLQRKAAVKVLAATDPVTEKRFAREAKLAGSLSHPNIVELYEVGRLEDGRAFLAMEYLEGETVEQRLRHRGVLSIAETMTIGQAVLRALGAAHEQQIVHRDICPENVFLAMVRGEEVVKILDFGISRHFGNAGDSTLTAPGTILGDIGYLAPEQLYEDGIVDQRTDLYATGILLYRMLTGQMPFPSKGPHLLVDIVERVPDAPSKVRPELPADVDRVIACALAKKAEDRFQSAESMAEALRLATIFAEYERV